VFDRVGLAVGGSYLLNGLDQAVLAVPGIAEAAVLSKVSVVIVCKGFGRLGDEDAACDCGVVVGIGSYDCQLFHDGGSRVVGCITAVKVVIKSPGGIAVDGDGSGVGGRATDCGIAGNGALFVLVKGVGGVEEVKALFS